MDDNTRDLTPFDDQIHDRALAEVLREIPTPDEMDESIFGVGSIPVATLEPNPLPPTAPLLVVELSHPNEFDPPEEPEPTEPDILLVSSTKLSSPPAPRPDPPPQLSSDEFHLTIDESGTVEDNPSPQPPPRNGEGESELFLPLSVSGRGPGGGVAVAELQVVTNLGLTVERATGQTLSAEILEITSEDAFAVQIVYTLLAPPLYGGLLLGEQPLQTGDCFTQQDVNDHQLFYQHGGSRAGNDAFTCVVSDGNGGLVENVTVEVGVLPLRAAPVLRSGVRINLGSIPAGLRQVEGCSVGEWLASALLDEDKHRAVGVAVVGLNGKARGLWQFSVEDGDEWRNFGDASLDNARLLRPEDLVRFLPGDDSVGETAMTFHAWDLTDGYAGDLVDLSQLDLLGGSTAFSAETGSATWTVLPRRKLTTLAPAPPVAPRSPATVGGRRVDTLLVGWNSDATDAREGIAVVGVTGNAFGVWQFTVNNGLNWVNFGEVYHGKARLLSGDDWVRFVPRGPMRGRPTLICRSWDGLERKAGEVVGLAGAGSTGGATGFGEEAVTVEW